MLIKKILCKIGIHKPIFIRQGFMDIVMDRLVCYYKCEWCKKVWMSYSAYSLFKVYRNVDDNE